MESNTTHNQEVGMTFFMLNTDSGEFVAVENATYESIADSHPSADGWMVSYTKSAPVMPLVVLA